RMTDGLRVPDMRARRPDQDDADEEGRQQLEEDVLREPHVERVAGDRDVVRREGVLAGPLLEAMEARELDGLRVRDVRHNDIGRAKLLLDRIRRLLCAESRRHEHSTTERKRQHAGEKARTQFHDLINRGSSSVERKKNTNRLSSAATTGSRTTRPTTNA